ncbi:MAG: YkgJ family cysteine cluster protein [Deltaproteobacteria bacterium]|nr:YkgJ family cysteine cluster protein [Deltaproteobacteria bacterium]
MSTIVRQWRCRRRGACCKLHRIQTTPAEQRRIAFALRAVGDPRAAIMERPLPSIAGMEHLPMTAEEHCIFLSRDNLCELRPFGPPPVYPSVCQTFPYLSIEAPDRHAFGLTLQCPTALELFAEEETFDVVTEPAGVEPPCERVFTLAQEGRPFTTVTGELVDEASFWATHWAWFDRFRASPEADPIARLTALALDVTGEPEPARPMVNRNLWRQAAFDSTLKRQLERLTGHAPRGLDFLWMDIPDEKLGPLPTPNTDASGLLLRYLLHRFLVPIHYVARADHAFHLTTMFAMACRWRIEMARGVPPIEACRHLDRLFVHIGNAAALLGTDASYPLWPSMCALANGVTV